MTMLSLTVGCRLLGVDPKTLRRWVQAANVPVVSHPSDGRIKGIASEHVVQLASIHTRPLRVPPGSASTGSWPGSHPASSSTSDEAILLSRLTHLETEVTRLQQSPSAVELQRLQAQLHGLQRRLSVLEMRMSEAMLGSTPAALCTPKDEQAEPPLLAGIRASLSAKSATRSTPHPPLIACKTSGEYGILEGQQGELHFQPESLEWFAWLATQTSFRFVGRQGSFSVYRKSRTSCGWTAYRTIHQHTYKRYLGTTKLMTIERLESMAARFQSYVSLRS
ncbi:hypothetical protein ccbrp13_36180 [Ktedonobacteria bacterium brp13]|nr:hypothetical protein ccbrp13_04230 [Ktedonobacteria bacterium brp13]BCL78094.1 hypothetical protein ccbrp13_05590 [Ktedonobacteria bacterium brp13]BCL79489.1 hypothetical protein ccbrp13_19540 [Ktedonobacteria bacterium brp13]BCL79742.1 hypothetical protein ccbrp13_22070 [Ktedonobacteria bacterium brp13]BCL81153.1 hypothetical protein ccbrp13_36180 [Ktedonobacteria bacterium brp13]